MKELNNKINQIFPGKVVRKDLVRKVRVGANVPVHVLEYLLGKYCATDDELAIQAGMDLKERDVVDILKDYMESGSFSRGREEITAKASICFLGNVNHPIDVLVKTSHLFQPLPDKMMDTALIDCIHYYLPGWDFSKMSRHLFTNDYGFVVDYLAKALRESRKLNYTEKLDRYFSFGDHLNARDAKASSC